MLIIYRLLSFLIFLLAPLYIKLRIFKKKENKQRVKEKYGITNKKRPPGPLVWIHGASLGEIKSAEILIKRLKKNKFNILVTSGTITSARWVDKNLSDIVIHQYNPIDCPIYLKRFIKAWKPNLVLWIESEVWPNTFYYIKKNNIPIIILNGRLSIKSYLGWQKISKTSNAIFSNITLCLVQSHEYRKRFKNLGIQTVFVLGNLKYTAKPLPYCCQDFDRLKDSLKNRTILLAASTQKKEEQIMLSLYLNIAQHIPNLLLIIIPRHATRGDEIAKLLKEKNIIFSQRSKDRTLPSNVSIYLCDTMGELGLFYRLSDLVVMGGSLVPHGGQNPLEAAILEKPIIYGRYRENFREMTDSLVKNKAIRIANNEDELYSNTIKLLSDKSSSRKLAKNAKDFALSQDNIIENYYKVISPFLESIKSEEDHIETT